MTGKNGGRAVVTGWPRERVPMRIQSNFSQSWVRVGSKFSQSWVRVESELSQSWVRVESEFSQSSVRAGSELSQSWVRVGSKFSQSWVRVGSELSQRKKGMEMGCLEGFWRILRDYIGFAMGCYDFLWFFMGWKGCSYEFLCYICSLVNNARLRPGNWMSDDCRDWGYCTLSNCWPKIKEIVVKRH